MAAPLPDGRVLVAGGYNGSSYLSSAEIFNPQTGTFSSAGLGAMGTTRAFAASAPLGDGRVLIAGGFYNDGTLHFLQTAEVFNPQTNSFSPVGPMSTPRDGAFGAPLMDGEALVAGGYAGGPYLSSAEVFNPQTNAFSTAGIGPMGTARALGAAARLPDGWVLIAGGLSGPTHLSSAEVFNPQNNTFSSAGIGSMGTAREVPAGAPLPDGRVLIVGGTADGITQLKSAEVFSPLTNTFSSAGIGSMSTGRYAPAAAPLPDGRVLVAGGYDGTGDLASAEIFAATNTFSFAVKGKRLIVSVQASGKVSVVDAASPLSASAARKKRKLLLKPSSASGDPSTITVPLRLTKLAKARLRQKGKVKVRARITFKPLGGLPNTRTAKLIIKSKRK